MVIKYLPDVVSYRTSESLLISNEILVRRVLRTRRLKVGKLGDASHIFLLDPVYSID